MYLDRIDNPLSMYGRPRWNLQVRYQSDKEREFLQKLKELFTEYGVCFVKQEDECGPEWNMMLTGYTIEGNDMDNPIKIDVSDCNDLVEGRMQVTEIPMNILK